MESTQAINETAAFRAIIAECVDALLEIPAATRDGWIQALDALAEAPGPRTADEFLLHDLLMTLRLVDVGRPPAVGGLPAIALRLTRTLHVVPLEVRQAWLDELHVRIRLGERVSSEEFGIAQVLLSLPVAASIATMCGRQDAPAS